MAYFDEVYAGPDDTLGFVCPEQAPSPGLVQELALAGSSSENTRADLLATLSPGVRAEAENALALAARLSETVPVRGVDGTTAEEERAIQQRLIDRRMRDGDVTPGGRLSMDRPI